MKKTTEQRISTSLFPQVDQFLVLLFLHLSEHHPLEHPEHVNSTQDHAGRAEYAVEHVCPERAQKNKELPHKAVRAGQRHRGERDDHEEDCQDGHGRGQTAEIGDHPRMPSLIEHPDDEKQAAGAYPVVQHLIDAPLHALHIESEHTEHHVTQVAHAGKGDEPFQVGLHHAHNGAVNDAHQSED